MSKVHTMSLNASSFERIKDGSKTIELRLYDEKRQQIQIGDGITFEPTNGSQDQVKTEVAALLRYPTFAAMIDDLPTEWFGLANKDVLKSGVYEHYTSDQEGKYGVVGIP